MTYIKIPRSWRGICLGAAYGRPRKYPAECETFICTLFLGGKLTSHPAVSIKKTGT